MELGYWGIRGLSEKIRYLLAHLNLDYTEKNPESFEEWQKQKANWTEEGHHFVNLPYLKDGDKVIAESRAIPHYLAQRESRTDLFGKNNEDQVKHEQLLGVIEGIEKCHWNILGTKNSKKVFVDGKDKMNGFLSSLDRFTGNKNFLLGYTTFADLSLYFSYTVHRSITRGLKEDNLFEKHQNVKRVIGNVEELDGLKDYLKNDKRAKRDLAGEDYLPCDPKLIQF